MKASIETITPALAKEWLALNNHNRNLKDSYILRLAGAIQRNEWILNGESIKLNGDVLVDGQHRLAAIIKANRAIESLVVRGVPVAAQETVDTGSRRTLSDILKIRGETNNSMMGTALVLLYQYQHEWIGRSATRTWPTVQESLALLEANPGLRDSLSWGNRARKHFRISSGLVAFEHYVFSQIDADDADDFFQKLITGINLEDGSPILALRRTFERDSLSANTRMSLAKRAALMIKAWNAYRDGDSVQLLKWNPGGARPEAFPVPA